MSSAPAKAAEGGGRSPLVARTEDYVRPYMANYEDISHDWSHILRVRKWALQLASAEGVTSPDSLLIVELAALLHDVGDSKFLKEGETAVALLRGFMEKEGFPHEVQEALLWIIPRVSFSYEKKNGFPAEGAHRTALACVQDADRLDAIGAVGIARCFSYSGKRNRVMYETGSAPTVESQPGGETARDHFTNKLLRLASMMKTEAGKAEALRRKGLLEKYCEEFDRECGLDAKGEEKAQKE